MFRINKQSKTFNDCSTAKAKEMSTNKDELLTIMTAYFSRTMDKEDVLAALAVLQTKMNPS